MSDQVDEAIKAAAAQDAAPTAVRLDIDLGNGKPPIVVVIPTPVTEIELFRLFYKLSTWYADQERQRMEKERGQPQLVVAPANIALPPPPRPTGHRN